MSASKETEQNLLGIKEAAALLNVSEMSLRRWSDAGDLKCLRVGKRRVRRFRRDDLFAFMDDGSQRAISEAPAHERACALVEGLPIEYGKHLCSFYESDSGRVKLAVPFLADGLRHGDACFLVAPDDLQEIFLEQLDAVSPEFARARSNGRFTLSSGRDSANAMYRHLEEEFLSATRNGSQTLRLVGDMAWAVDKGFNTAELMEFESRYNSGIGHRFPVVSLCQYDARRFSGSGILNALRYHEDTFEYPLQRFLC